MFPKRMLIGQTKITYTCMMAFLLIMRNFNLTKRKYRKNPTRGIVYKRTDQ